jgi:hypothetical protein
MHCSHFFLNIFQNQLFLVYMWTQNWNITTSKINFFLFAIL